MYSPPPPNITNNIDFFFFREAGGVDVRRLGIPSVSWGVAAYFSCEIYTYLCMQQDYICTCSLKLKKNERKNSQ